jgi:hypothetical protein
MFQAFNPATPLSFDLDISPAEQIEAWFVKNRGKSMLRG